MKGTNLPSTLTSMFRNIALLTHFLRQRFFLSISILLLSSSSVESLMKVIPKFIIQLYEFVFFVSFQNYNCNLYLPEKRNIKFLFLSIFFHFSEWSFRSPRIRGSSSDSLFWVSYVLNPKLDLLPSRFSLISKKFSTVIYRQIFGEFYANFVATLRK